MLRADFGFGRLNDAPIRRQGAAYVAALLLVAWALATSSARAITFEAEYVFPELFPQPMRTAFDYTANELLGYELVSAYRNENVDVLMRWRELGWPGPYATAGVFMWRNFESGDPSYKKDTYYPGALADHLAGKDIAGGDIVITLNISSLIDGKVSWYFGRDGQAKPGEIDFVTVLLHELVHGIGFFSTIRGNGSFSDINPPGPAIYDRFAAGIVFDEASKPVKTLALPEMQTDADRARAVIWPELMWSGEHGKRGANTDVLFLFAPPVFDESLSVSHIDPTQSSLMNPFYGGATHVIDAITLGMLSDMGWHVRQNTAVAEPPSVALLGLALAMLCLVRRRRMSSPLTRIGFGRTVPAMLLLLLASGTNTSLAGPIFIQGYTLAVRGIEQPRPTFCTPSTAYLMALYGETRGFDLLKDGATADAQVQALATLLNVQPGQGADSDDITKGLKAMYGGYLVDGAGNKYKDAWSQARGEGDWTWSDIRARIDANLPIMLGVEGSDINHVVFGFGYEEINAGKPGEELYAYILDPFADASGGHNSTAKNPKKWRIDRHDLKILDAFDALDNKTQHVDREGHPYKGVGLLALFTGNSVVAEPGTLLLVFPGAALLICIRWQRERTGATCRLLRSNKATP